MQLARELDQAQLWLPSLDLAGCVRAAFVRDSGGVPSASPLSHFPVTPLAGLIWWFEGSTECIAAPGFAPLQGPDAVGPLLLAGPFNLPSITRSSGPVRVLHLMLQPDALHALTGIEPAAWVNRVVDARPLLSADWRAWAASLAALPSMAARLEAIEAFLRPRWAAVAAGRSLAQRYHGWTEQLAMRAATSGSGRSLRQLERRVKAWAGLPLRELRGIARAEAAFFSSVAAAQAGSLQWSAVAAEHGYADQSHLCRETRRLTGFSPAELARRLQGDPSFWAYRLWL
jgi:AraC-like DNA-binding protein